LLDRENVSLLFTCILLEQKIIVYSEKISVLTVITESLLTLIFPFKVCANRACVPSFPPYFSGFAQNDACLWISILWCMLVNTQIEIQKHTSTDDNIQIPPLYLCSGTMYTCLSFPSNC
jgi:hypothetical protein